MRGLTIAIPHRNVSVESQMLGRTLLRSTLLGTCRNDLGHWRTSTKRRTCLEDRVGKVKNSEAQQIFLIAEMQIGCHVVELGGI